MPITRRDFLLEAAAGAASLGLLGCGNLRGHALPDRPRAPGSSTVGMVRPTQFSSLKDAVRQAISLAGGLGFIAPGDSVLLKPAHNSGNEYPATADPETLMIVAGMVQELGGVPFIADRTMFMNNTLDAFKNSGMWDGAMGAHVDIKSLDNAAVVTLHHPLAKHWPGHVIPVYKPVVDADHIINFCTPRTHFMGDFTMSLKNHVGVVHGVSRTGMHVELGFKQRLAEIILVTSPSLIVMDGRKGFTNGGPDSGDLATLDFISVGTDPVAMDALGLAHLRLAGTNDSIGKGSVWEIPMLKRAVEIGVGVGSADAINVVGMMDSDVESLKSQMA